MSYIDKIAINGFGGLLAGAFGQLKTAGQGQRLDGEFIYNKNEEIFDHVETSGATITHNDTSRDLTLAIVGTGNTASALSSSYPVPYTAGNGQEIFTTGVLNLRNVAGGECSVFLRSTVTGSTVLTTVPQTSWSENKYTNADWKLSQILGFDFQSLKVGKIRFTADIDGTQTIVHEITNDNRIDSGYWQTPHLPAMYRIYNDATYTYMEMGYGDEFNGIGFRYRVLKNASATMKAICCTVKSRGGQHLVDLPTYNRVADRGTNSKTVSNSYVPILSVRPRSTFNSLPNNALALVSSLGISTDNDIHLRIIHNATLTGATWNDVDTDESMMEVDIAATAYSGGHVLFSDYYSTGTKNSDSSFASVLGKAILWNRKNGDSGIISVVAVRTDSSNASVFASLRIGEIR